MDAVCECLLKFRKVWFMTFHMELEANFGTFDLVREAEAEIKTLVMAEGSHSAIYFMEFNRLASRIQWDDHALLRQAYKGLACHIKNEMVHHDQPITLLDFHKLVQAINYHYWEWKAEIMRKANPTSKVDPKGDLKSTRNPKAAPKGKAPENLKSGLDLTGKLGKDGKLTLQERQRHMDNSLCLFCGKTGAYWACRQGVPKADGCCRPSPCRHCRATGVLH